MKSAYWKSSSSSRTGHQSVLLRKIMVLNRINAQSRNHHYLFVTRCTHIYMQHFTLCVMCFHLIQNTVAGTKLNILSQMLTNITFTQNMIDENHESNLITTNFSISLRNDTLMYTIPTMLAYFTWHTGHWNNGAYDSKMYSFTKTNILKLQYC